MFYAIGECRRPLRTIKLGGPLALLSVSCRRPVSPNSVLSLKFSDSLFSVFSLSCLYPDHRSLCFGSGRLLRCRTKGGSSWFGANYCRSLLQKHVWGEIRSCSVCLCSSLSCRQRLLGHFLTRSPQSSARTRRSGSIFKVFGL